VRILRWGPGLLALGLAAACAPGSSLPEFARPVGRVVRSDSVEAKDLIPYRELVREDFRGTGPPAPYAPYRDEVGAATCGLISPELQIRARRAGEEYEGYVENLRFTALMDRECSWWNEDNDADPEDYVLQHEQIHFALFELAARRLDADASEIASHLRARGATPRLAMEATEARLRELLEDTARELLARSQAFDEDTSLSLDREAQREWADRVERELAESRP
jgi:hypothetical protein